MSFVEKFAAGVSIETDRADITLSEAGESPNSKKSKSLSRGNTIRDRGGSQSAAGIVTGNFGSHKEVDQDRFPHKNWVNSRIPG